MKRFVCLSILGLVACSDSTLAPSDASTPDATDATAEASIDAGSDASVDAPGTDAPKDGPGPFVKPTPFALALSTKGPDQLQSVTPGPNGSFYAAGYAAQTATGAKYITVVKRTASGPDTTFGASGIATTNVEFVGGADDIDIAVQPSGKILVSATVANAINSADRDIAIVRLGTDGKVDPTFGKDGVVTIDLNTATDATQSAQRDVARSIAVGPGGVIYVHGAQRGLLARTDSDFAVVKLTEAGVVDTTWGTNGKFTLDFGSPSANATPRGLQALSDGSVLASGYATSSLTGDIAQPVLYKLTATGVLDATFADKGLFHATVLTLQAEVYNFAVHGNNFVTGGYGRNTGTTNDWLSLRFDLASGKRDTTWGGSAGYVLFDPSGKNLGSNCRSAAALPDGKTLLMGSTGPSNTPQQDAVFAILNASGALDTSYGTGVHVLPFGANEGGNDQFWGGAVSGNNVLIVGYKGSGTTQTETANDDSYAIVFPLQ